MTILGKLKASEIKIRALKLLEVHTTHRFDPSFFPVLMRGAARMLACGTVWRTYRRS
jgi:hypothetical protein